MKRVLLIGLLFAAPAVAQVRVEPLALVPAGPVEAARTTSGVVSASNGQEFLVAYRDTRGSRAARVASSGEVLDPYGIPLPVDPEAVVWAGSHYFIFLGSLFVRVSPEGRVVDRAPRTIKTSGAIHTPIVASDGKRVLVCIDARVLHLIDGDETIATVRVPGWEVVGAASNGRMFRVLLTDNRQFATFDISAKGQPLDAAPRVVRDPCSRAKIASDGEEFVVVCDADAIAWTGSSYLVATRVETLTFQGLSLQRVGRNGEPLSARELRPLPSFVRGVAVASNGAQTLLTHSTGPLTSVLLTDAGESEPFATTFNSAPQTAVSAAHDGERWLVAWSESTGIYATHAGAGSRIHIAEGPAGSTRTAWTGATFLVVADRGNTLYSHAVTSGNATLITQEFVRYAIAGGSDGAVVAWTTDRQLHFAFFDRDGRLTRDQQVPTDDPVLALEGSFDGSRSVFARTEGTPNPSYPCRFGSCSRYLEIRTLVTFAGTDVLVARLPTISFYPEPVLSALAWARGTGLVMWRSATHSSYALLGAASLIPALFEHGGSFVSAAGDGDTFIIQLYDGSATSRLFVMTPAGERSPAVEVPLRLRTLVPGSDRRVLAIGAVFGTEGADAGVPRVATALIVDEFTPR